MIPRIKNIVTKEDYKLIVTFDDDVTVMYDLYEDIQTIDAFKALDGHPEMVSLFSIDQSRTCVTWTENIDLPSDTIREYGKVL